MSSNVCRLDFCERPLVLVQLKKREKKKTVLKWMSQNADLNLSGKLQ